MFQINQYSKDMQQSRHDKSQELLISAYNFDQLEYPLDLIAWIFVELSTQICQGLMDTEDVSEMDIRGHSTDIYLEKKKLAQLKRRLIILVVLVSSVVCVLLFRQLFALQQVNVQYLEKINEKITRMESSEPRHPDEKTQTEVSQSPSNIDPSINCDSAQQRVHTNELNLKIQNLNKAIQQSQNQEKILKARITQLEASNQQLNRQNDDYRRRGTNQADNKDLILELEQKRRNEDVFRTLINSTYIKYGIGDHYFDNKLYELLAIYYAKKNINSIVDLGCGRCEYITKLHDEKGYDTQGYDGSPYSQNPIVAQMDLSQVVQLGKTYDYVQSFQVGEHIFSVFENNFIGNIVRHARKGIVMSWSVIGQEGYMHVNNRNNDYVIQKVESHGFIFNKEDTTWFRSQLVKHFSWTIMVFDKRP